MAREPDPAARDLVRRLKSLLREGASVPDSISADPGVDSHPLQDWVETTGSTDPVLEPLEEPSAAAFERGLQIQAREGGPPAGAPGDGVDYLVARMFAEHPEWAVVALEGNAAELAPRLASLLGCERWVADAADRPLASAPVERFLLRLRGHGWSLLLQLRLAPLSQLAQQAAGLSERLGCRTVAFGHVDAGGSLAQLFDGGRPVRAAKSRNGWSGFFGKLELFVPFFGFASQGGTTQLFLEGVTRDQIESLDYFAGRSV
jgi:hypothetical protein